MNKWISVKEKMPPACQQLIVVRTVKGRAKMDWYYISIHPKECVEDDKITHWMHVPKMPEGE